MASTPINMASVSLATVAAGPLFLLGLGLGVMIDHPDLAVPIDLGGRALQIAMGVLMALFATMIVGSVIALLPNIVGTAVMIHLGEANEGFRLPVMWGMVGGLAGGMAALPFGGEWDGGPPVTLLALVFTGACCALICRRRLLWEA